MKCDHGKEVACAACHGETRLGAIERDVRLALGWEGDCLTIRCDRGRWTVENTGKKQRRGMGATLEHAMRDWLEELEREPNDLDEEQAPAEELVEVEE